MCSILCQVISIKLHGGKRLVGEGHGFRYPLNKSEIGDGKFGDSAFFTKALRASGAITEKERVSKVSLFDFKSTGLLSDIGACAIEYDVETEGPAELILKFAPAEFETRITTDLFALARTEYFVYKDLINKGLMPMTTPKMFYGDYNQKSKNYCFALERASGQFRDQVAAPLSLDDALIMVRNLARFHSKWYGREGISKPEVQFIPLQSAPTYKIFGGVVKQHWNAGVKSNAPNKLSHSGWTYKIPDSYRELVDDIINNYTNLLYYASESCDGVVGVTHGDTRLDNWFFFTKKDGATDAGILDFQIMTRSSTPADLAWMLCTSCSSEFAAEHEQVLIDKYLECLETSLGKTVNREMWMQEYALSFIGCIGKNIIGAGGIKAIEDHVIKTMNMLMCGGFDAWERQNVATVYAKWRAGKLISQQQPNYKKPPAMTYTEKFYNKYDASL
jgi:hypothetical protein